MNKVWKTAMLCVCALAFCGIATAQTLKVGVLDNDRLREGYSTLKATLAQLDAQINARKQALKAKQAEFNVKVKEYEAQKDLLKDEEKRARQQKLMEESSNLRDELSNANDEIYKEQEKALKPFVAKIQAAVDKVAKEQHLDLVLKRDNLAYFNPSLDITDRVIVELTKKPGSK